VAFVDDQGPVEQFAAQGSNYSFADRVRPGGLVRIRMCGCPKLGLWVPNWSSTSCDLGVFVYQPTGQIATSEGGWDGDAGVGSD
jgi:hypothetical protein